MAPVTQADIARQLGLHQTTVSAILDGKRANRYSEETRRRVWGIARQVGYRPSAPARSLRGSRSGLIGLFHFGRDKDVELHRLHELVLAIHDCGYRPLAMPMATSVMWVERDAGSACNSMLDAKVEGLVLSGFSDDFDLNLLERFQHAQIPIVSVSGLKLPEIPHFFPDRQQAAYALTSHLIKSGRTRLAYIGRQPSSLESIPQDRALSGLEGFRRALKEADRAQVVGNSMIQPSPLLTGLSAMDSGNKIFHEMWHGDYRPDGVICYDDAWAFGVYGYCLRHGIRIPQDVAVVGFENQKFCEHLVPRLTSVAIPNQAMARAALTALTKLIDGDQRPVECRDQMFPCELVIRESCGNPNPA